MSPPTAGETENDRSTVGTGSRSSTVRGVVLSSGGLAFAIIFNLSIEMLGDAWSKSPILVPLQAFARILLPLFLIFLAGWFFFGRPWRFRFTLAAERERPIGPVGPVVPRWSPKPPGPADSGVILACHEVLERLERSTSDIDADPRAHAAVPVHRDVLVYGPEPDRLVQVAEGAAHGVPTDHVVAYFDLTSSNGIRVEDQGISPLRYAVACTILRALDLGVPGWSLEALRIARRRIIEATGGRPMLLVLTGVGREETVDWLLPDGPPDELHLLMTGPERLAGLEVESVPLEAGRSWKPLDEDQVRRRIHDLDTGSRILLRALAELPPCALSLGAIAAVNATIHPTGTIEAPAAPSPSKGLLEDRLALLAEKNLVERLQAQDVHRFRVPTLAHREIKILLSDEDTQKPVEDKVWAEAEGAVLAYYARLTSHWSRDLQTRDRADDAALWFRYEEPLLYHLITGLEPKKPDARSDLVLEDLGRIGSGLDIWYTRENQPPRAKAIFRQLEKVAEKAGHMVICELSRIRRDAALRQLEQADTPTLDVLEKEQQRLGEAKRIGWRQIGAPLEARKWFALGLRCLDTERPNAARLELARHAFQRVWMQTPRTDVRGEVSVLINLAIVHLFQGQLDRARERLNVAAFLTESTDPPGRAHVLELKGIVAWSGGELHLAIDLWMQARDLFEQLKASEGQSRCLQHLGRTVLSDPRLARPEPGHEAEPLNEAVAIERANGWLKRSRELRPGRSDGADAGSRAS